MSTTSTRRFFRDLQQSDLLDPEQIDAAQTQAKNSPSRAIRQLVADGKITKWQARKILQGSTKFFYGKGNKYKLLRKIGKGGMGVVYKAEQVSMGRVVALKVMSTSLMGRSRNVSRFLREIQVTARFDHPNIIRAYDADVHDGSYFLVMEYLRGRNVREWLQTSRRPVQCATACDLVMQAATGLQHVHERELVHRDIKPSNLFLTVNTEGRMIVKLLDLGLSRLTTELNVDGGMTRAGHAVGTLNYMAPEQMRSSRDVDIRADVYALGCTLFELLTRRLPFSASDPLKSAMVKLNEEAPRVSSVWPAVPVALDEIVARMLERERDRRYAAPLEVAAALAEVKERLERRKADRIARAKTGKQHSDDSTFSDVAFLTPDESYESLSSQDTLGVRGSLTVELARIAEQVNDSYQTDALSVAVELSAFSRDSVPTTDALLRVHRAFVQNIERVSNLAKLPQTHPATGTALDAILSSMVVGSWTAFETLAGDLWEAALNANAKWGLLGGNATRIRALAGDAAPDGQQTVNRTLSPQPTLAEMYIVTNGTYDLSGKMGTLHRPRFQFSTLREIRESYAAAFQPEVACVDSLLSNKALDVLQCVRNLLVQKAGIADEMDVTMCRQADTAATIEAGSRIRLDAAIVSHLIDPVIRIAESLLRGVDGQIACQNVV
jgi:serine/threonine protein kinase